MTIYRQFEACQPALFYPFYSSSFDEAKKIFVFLCFLCFVRSIFVLFFHSHHFHSLPTHCSRFVIKLFKPDQVVYVLLLLSLLFCCSADLACMQISACVCVVVGCFAAMSRVLQILQTRASYNVILTVQCPRLFVRHEQHRIQNERNKQKSQHSRAQTERLSEPNNEFNRKTYKLKREHSHTHTYKSRARRSPNAYEHSLSLCSLKKTLI